MSEKFDLRTVFAIIIGSFIMSIINLGIWHHNVFSPEISIPLSAIVVVVLAAMYGVIAGVMIPVIGCFVFGAVVDTSVAIAEMLALLALGLSAGFYMDKFMVHKGDFDGIRVLDFCVVQLQSSTIVWMFLRPLCLFYLYKYDIGEALFSSFTSFAIAMGVQVFICAPVLMLLSKHIKRNLLMRGAGSNINGNM